MAYSCCNAMHQNIVNKDLKITVNDKPQGLHGNKIKIINRELFNIYVRFIKRTENSTKTPCTMIETLLCTDEQYTSTPQSLDVRSI